MFRWFYKKKTDDDDFVLLDIHDAHVSVRNESSDVTPDTVSDVTSVPEYICTYYDPPTTQYDLTRIEPIDSSIHQGSSELQQSVQTDSENSDEYNYDNVEDITEEINSSETFYKQVSWNHVKAIHTPAYEIDPLYDSRNIDTLHNENATEKGLRNVLEFFIRVDMMLEDLITL
jgi:hypothetical protein